MDTFEKVPFRERYYEKVGGLYDLYLLHAVSSGSPGLIEFEKDFDEEVDAVAAECILLDEEKPVHQGIVWLAMPGPERSALIAASTAIKINELTYGLNQAELRTLFIDAVQLLINDPPAGIVTNNIPYFKQALYGVGDPLSGNSLSENEIKNLVLDDYATAS